MPTHKSNSSNSKPLCFTLSNNIRGIYDPSAKSSKTATIVVFFKVGSRDEPKGYWGISHFIEHMFFKGTQKRKEAMEISSSIDQYGGIFNASTEYDYTNYYVKINRDYFHVAVEILSDILSNSLFKASEIKTECNVVLNELKINRSNPSRKVQEILGNLHFKGTPKEHDVGGIDKDVKATTRGKMLKYLQYFYQPENIVLSISGDTGLSKNSIVKLCEKYFGHFNQKIVKQSKSSTKNSSTKNTSNSSNSSNTTRFIPRHKQTIINFPNLQSEFRYGNEVYPKASNVSIAMAFPTEPLSSPDYKVYELIHSLLGANMSSRLFVRVREQHGLTYNIKTNVEAVEDTGTFSITFATNPDLKSVHKSIQLVLDELGKLKSKTSRISKTEIKKGIEYLIGKTLIDREDTSDIANTNGKHMLYLDKFVNYETEFRKLRQLTAHDVHRVANKIFHVSKLSISIISPFSIPKLPEDILRL